MTNQVVHPEPPAIPNVLNLKGEPANPAELAEYDLGLVEILETCIRDVKKGKINSVAVVMCRYADDNHPQEKNDYMQIDTTWQGKRLLLLAGATRLLHRLNIDQDENG